MNPNTDSPGDPRFNPRSPIRIRDLREMWEMAHSSQRFSAGGIDTELAGKGGNRQALDGLPSLFWARLTTPPQDPTSDDPYLSTLYSFIEVQDIGNGVDWTTFPGAIRGNYTALSLDRSTSVPVPGGPLNLTGGTGGGGGSLQGGLYYLVTALWTNTVTGKTNLQSPASNELILGGTGTGSIDLSWTAPAPAQSYTLTGYQVWRGPSSGGENVLVATLGNITTYTDTGGGTSNSSPIPGGNAGPIVLMSPYSSADNFFKFIPPVASGALNLANTWVRVTSASPSVIYCGRRVIDAILVNGSTTLTSASANFTIFDTRGYVRGAGIPDGTTLPFVTSSTTGTMSQAATEDLSPATVDIVTPLVAYPAILGTSYINGRVLYDATFTTGSTTLTTTTDEFTVNDLWATLIGDGLAPGTTIQEVISPTEVVLNQPTVGAPGPTVTVLPAGVDFTLPEPEVWFIDVNGAAPTTSWYYEAKLIGYDVDGIPIYTSSLPPLNFARVTSSQTSEVELDDGSTITAWPATFGVAYQQGHYLDGVETGWVVEVNGATLLPGWRYQCRLFGQDIYGGRIFATTLPPLQFVTVTNSAPVEVTLEDNSLIAVWPATLGVTYSGSAWHDGTKYVYFVDINGSSPQVDVRYQCRLFGQTKVRHVIDGVLTNGSTTLISATAGFTSADLYSPVRGYGIPDGTVINSVLSTSSVVLSEAATVNQTSSIVSIGGVEIWASAAGVSSPGAVLVQAGPVTVYPVDFSGTTYYCISAGIVGSGPPMIGIWLTNPNLPGTYPSGPDFTWMGTGFVSNWLYLAVPTGLTDSSGVPLYKTVDMPNASPLNRGAVNVGSQTFGGTKTFESWTDAQSRADIIVTDALAAECTPFTGFPAYGFAEFYGRQGGFSILDSAAVIASVTNNSSGTNFQTLQELWVGPGYICFGTPAPLGNTQGGGAIPAPGSTLLYVTVGNPQATTYAGSTGMDAAGSIFINGLCVVPGNIAGGGGSNTLITKPLNGGSDW